MTKRLAQLVGCGLIGHVFPKSDKITGPMSSEGPFVYLRRMSKTKCGVCGLPYDSYLKGEDNA